MPIITLDASASRNVAVCEYNDDTSALVVHFRDRKTGEASPIRYTYAGVPGDTVQQLQESDSLGGAVQALIVRGGYEFAKVDTSQEQAQGDDRV